MKPFGLFEYQRLSGLLTSSYPRGSCSSTSARKAVPANLSANHLQEFATDCVWVANCCKSIQRLEEPRVSARRCKLLQMGANDCKSLHYGRVSKLFGFGVQIWDCLQMVANSCKWLQLLQMVAKACTKVEFPNFLVQIWDCCWLYCISSD